MAKVYGLFGSMTGKLADVVMSVRNGVQVARKYQPVVYNPSTIAQVSARARLKLMSQLSAIYMPVVAIRRQGNVSSRNLFVKKNYHMATYADNTASVQFSGIKLTDSVVALPAIVATRSEGNITVALQRAATDLSRVVYAFFIHEGDEVRLIGSRVVSTPGDAQLFEASFAALTNEYFVYAYGVRDNTEAARVAFGELTAPTAQQVAQLVVTRLLLESDVTLTETKSATVAAQNV